jgi:hypothetical protein
MPMYSMLARSQRLSLLPQWVHLKHSLLWGEATWAAALHFTPPTLRPECTGALSTLCAALAHLGIYLATVATLLLVRVFNQRGCLCRGCDAVWVAAKRRHCSPCSHRLTLPKRCYDAALHPCRSLRWLGGSQSWSPCHK